MSYLPRYTSLAAVRQALRIPDTPQAADWRPGGQGDAGLLATIEAAESAVDQVCGRTFDAPAAEASPRRFAVDVRTYEAGGSFIPLPVVPVDEFAPAAGDRARFRPRGCAWEDLAAGEWEPVLDPLEPGVAGAVRLWPDGASASGPGDLELTVRWGRARVPPQVAEASKLLSARLAQREASPLGVTVVSDMGMYVSRVDHDVRSLLAPWAGSKIGVA